MKYYLAYGSNLNKEQMAHRCPGAVPVGAAMIEGYQLVFRRGVLTIEPKEGSSVPVGIWKISAADEKSLDRYEGYPKFYIKKKFDIGMAYIMVDGHPIQKPSDAYLLTVTKGYADFGFDQQILKEAYYRSYYQT
jgi:hypothetical protein